MAKNLQNSHFYLLLVVKGRLKQLEEKTKMNQK